MRIVTLICLMLCSIATYSQTLVSYSDDLEKDEYVKNPNKSQESFNNVKKDIPFSLAQKVKDIYASALGPHIPVTTYIRTCIYFNSKGRVDHWVYSFEDYNFNFRTGEQQQKPKRNIDSLNRILSERLPAQVKDFISKRHVGRKSQLVLVTQLQTTDPREIARMDSITNKFLENNKTEPVTVEIKNHVVKGLANALLVQDTLLVKELYLEREMLETVPEVIYRFPNLETLSLADNDIEVVKLNFKRLPKLDHLRLSGNIIGNKGLKFNKNNTLKLLNLQSNVLTSVADGSRKCKNLETLWLGKNTLVRLKNRSFRNLKQVKDINFYQAEITSLPKGIKKMKGLEVLDLYYNQLTSLPKSVAALRNLTHLAVAHNQLSTLPEEIGEMTKLHTLYAHHNQLSKLPGSIVKLQSLQIVDLGYNWFTEFPEALTKFPNLDELDISGNNLTEFPNNLLGIKKLNKLHLRGNPFLTEDREVKYGQQFGLLKSKNIEVFY
jgi:Leucine-rich repeat (LRR) protein